MSEECGIITYRSEYKCYINICVEIEVGNRPHNNSSAKRYTNLVEKFASQIGKPYTQKQHKNRWDTLCDFVNSFVHTTRIGIGWDSKLIKKILFFALTLFQCILYELYIIRDISDIVRSSRLKGHICRRIKRQDKHTDSAFTPAATVKANLLKTTWQNKFEKIVTVWV
jgi:hypothetical protein